MIFNTKLVTGYATSAFVFGVTFLLTKAGVHASPEVTQLLPGLLAGPIGAVAGFLVKEENALAPEVERLDARIQGVYDRLPAPVRQDLQQAAKPVEDAALTEAKTVVAELDHTAQAAALISQHNAEQASGQNPAS